MANMDVDQDARERNVHEVKVAASSLALHSELSRTVESPVLFRAASNAPSTSRPKFTPANSFQVEVEELPSASRSGSAHSSDVYGHSKSQRWLWWTRTQKAFVTKFPRATKGVVWLRGPRPKVDLPDPKPWLDIDWTTRRGRIVFPLERMWARHTRFLGHTWLLVLFIAAYIISFAFFARAQAFLTPAESFIDCTSTYWTALDGCGLNGELCTPFNQSSFDFRCPAQCTSVVLANPRFVGDTSVDGVPLIVGGGDNNKTYRGDSFICAAAVQAGMYSDSTGGCATVTLIGTFQNFLPYSANGLSSIGFPSQFPLSFRFEPTTAIGHCTDLRNYALAFNIIITVLLFWVIRPPPIVTYWCLVCIGFWHVTLFSQPRAQPPPIDDAFGTFLPTLFVAYAFWRLSFRFTMPAFYRAGAHLESAIWYLATYWAGVLTNITTDQIPIDRLDSSDIDDSRRAIVALVIICVIIFVIVLRQIWDIRKTGWLPYYAGWYIVGGLTTMVLALLPGLSFRLHHYVLAMVLIPGTGFPTRLSAIYQGFLLGMFLNGVAAFDFDSILQTAADLVRDAPLGTDLPTFATNSTTLNASLPLVNQTIFWHTFPANDTWDGFSLLVDDVERYTGAALNFSLGTLLSFNALQTGIPHFFRLAFTSGGVPGDYTKAGTISTNETWTDPLPGPS